MPCHHLSCFMFHLLLSLFLFSLHVFAFGCSHFPPPSCVFVLHPWNSTGCQGLNVGVYLCAAHTVSHIALQMLVCQERANDVIFPMLFVWTNIMYFVFYRSRNFIILCECYKLHNQFHRNFCNYTFCISRVFFMAAVHIGLKCS